MNREEEVKIISQLLIKKCGSCDLKQYGRARFACCDECKANILLNAGYGNIMQALTEFANVITSSLELRQKILSDQSKKICIPQIKDTYNAAISTLNDCIELVKQTLNASENDNNEEG